MDIWHIVGNGLGKSMVAENEKVIRFNQPLVLSASTTLTITNSKVAGLKKGVLVQGKPPGVRFAERLEANNRELENPDSFSCLLELPDLPRHEASQLLLTLSKVSFHTWLEQANSKKLKAIEPLFYISGYRHISPNWWMYDNQLSIHVNRLQRTLALVQQAFEQVEKVKV